MNRRDQKKAYPEWRKAVAILHGKIFEKCAERRDVLDAGRELGMRRGDKIASERYEDFEALRDFVTYEARPGKRSYVQRYAQEVGGADAMEATLLECMLNAYTSLFAVFDMNKTTSRVTTRDVMAPEKELEIIDINMCNSGAPGLVFYGRLIPCPEFTITAGVVFPFGGQHAEFLLHEILKFDRVKLPGLRQRKVYARMYQLCNKIGLHRTYK